MGKIDREKEYIGALKAYLGFILAVILAIGTGLVKLYLNVWDFVLDRLYSHFKCNCFVFLCRKNITFTH